VHSPLQQLQYVHFKVWLQFFSYLHFKLINVTLREVICKYLKLTEPHLVAGRIGNQLIHQTFYAAGVNHFWAMDQHDKWWQFGLFWHGCLDGFTGKILWLVVWWNNSNPKFGCSQYIKAIRKFGGMSIDFFTELNLSTSSM
jgi:hypothetical protein